MSGLVEVVDAGVAVTIQDRGRRGYRSIGVPVSGALDPLLLAAANALLGNPPDAAGLEVCLGGPGLKAVSGTVRIALAGEVEAKVVRGKGTVLKVLPWQTATLFPGDVAQIGAVTRGIAYVGITGGFDVPLQLGSRSTYPRAALGGVRGRAIAVGDHLPCSALHRDPWLESCSPAPLPRAEGPVRVILGPQDEHFTPGALAAFLAEPYQVTRDMDRMGMRLEGPRLTHNERGAEIISDGVTPGAIQVPANGQPIVLLADCQTSGGYPKIATVIRADLGRLGHLKPGSEIRFRSVTQAEAADALRAQTGSFARWTEGLQSFRPPGAIDEVALYGGNLVSGVVRGDEPGAVAHP